MRSNNFKITRSILNALVILLSFEGLIAILNLNQPVLYVQTAFYVGIFYIVQILILYDLHVRNPGSLARAQKKHESVSHWLVKGGKIFFSACGDRFSHLSKWNFLSLWLNYMILPAIIFWSTIAIFFINFGFPKNQQIFVALSGIALMLNYWYLREVFTRGKEVVDKDIFVVLSVVKIYGGCIAYGASLALVRRYCLAPTLLMSVVFALTFFLIYQALFQHKKVNISNLLVTLLIALVMSQLANLALVYWGYNYFTAAVVLAAAYNLMWGIFHYRLDRALTWQAFWEIFIVSLIIAAMIFSVTNFRARILDDCQYNLTL